MAAGLESPWETPWWRMQICFSFLFIVNFIFSSSVFSCRAPIDLVGLIVDIIISSTCHSIQSLFIRSAREKRISKRSEYCIFFISQRYANASEMKLLTSTWLLILLFCKSRRKHNVNLVGKLPYAGKIESTIHEYKFSCRVRYEQLCKLNSSFSEILDKFSNSLELSWQPFNDTSVQSRFYRV